MTEHLIIILFAVFISGLLCGFFGCALHLKMRMDAYERKHHPTNNNLK